MTEVVTLPEVVLEAHTTGGISFAVSEADENGASVDISGLSLHVEFENEDPIDLVADPLNTNGLLLIIPEVTIASIGAGNEEKFSLILEGPPDEVIAYGRVVVKGW